MQEHTTEYKTQDPRVYQELIESIDKAYFTDDQALDVIEYDLSVSKNTFTTDSNWSSHIDMNKIMAIPIDIEVETWNFATDFGTCTVQHRYWNMDFHLRSGSTKFLHWYEFQSDDLHYSKICKKL